MVVIAGYLYLYMLGMTYIISERLNSVFYWFKSWVNFFIGHGAMENHYFILRFQRITPELLVIKRILIYMDQIL